MKQGYDRVFEEAQSRDLVASQNGTRFAARCPAHEDSRASLAVAKGDDGRALVHCFAGCDLPSIVEGLGMTIAELFGGEKRDYDTAQYVYTDESGAPLVRVTRTWPKGFRQERWDAGDQMWKPRLEGVRRVLYNLPQVATAQTVWLVEGEKDAENLKTEGVVSTTLLGGAGNWREEYAESLRGKHVNIIADRDPAGQEGALKVRNALRGVAQVDLWVAPVPWKDVSDMLAAGAGLGDLERLQQDDGMFQPMSWEDWEAEEVNWLLEPWLPAQGRVMAFGAAGSLKSLWAMWVGSQLAKEGHRVAYFSLEMPPREVARRLKKMAPPEDKFRLFRKLSFDSASDLAAACDLLRGYSLIVVDSWSAVHGDTNNNDAVARLDREFFLPLIEETGASLMILDNTGQNVLTDRGQKMAPDWARGASAKGDKMDLTIHFEKPEDTNHTTRMKVKKMRYDRGAPKPITVRTDPDVIDFRMIDDHGVDLGSMWTSEGPPPPPEDVPDAPPSLLERLRIAKEIAKLGGQK